MKVLRYTSFKTPRGLNQSELIERIGYKKHYNGWVKITKDGRFHLNNDGEKYNIHFDINVGNGHMVLPSLVTLQREVNRIKRIIKRLPITLPVKKKIIKKPKEESKNKKVEFAKISNYQYQLLKQENERNRNSRGNARQESVSRGSGTNENTACGIIRFLLRAIRNYTVKKTKDLASDETKP